MASILSFPVSGPSERDRKIVDEVVVGYQDPVDEREAAVRVELSPGLVSAPGAGRPRERPLHRGIFSGQTGAVAMSHGGGSFLLFGRRRGAGGEGQLSFAGGLWPIYEMGRRFANQTLDRPHKCCL